MSDNIRRHCHIVNENVHINVS